MVGKIDLVTVIIIIITDSTVHECLNMIWVWIQWNKASSSLAPRNEMIKIDKSEKLVQKNYWWFVKWHGHRK